MVVDPMSTSEMNASLLPTYAPSAPSPNYTCEPTNGEETLQRTPSLGLPPLTGTYTKESEKVVITLFDQEENVKMPTYGRQGLISGTIHLDDSQLVLRVIVKIEGKLESSCFEGGYKSVKLISHHSTLWEKAEHSDNCPSLIPFSCVLPATFDAGDCKPPLPPSYASRSTGSPSILVRSHYFINVCVDRIRHPIVGFLTATKRIIIPFNYYPRTRAHRPIIASPDFFSSVKSSPGEWYQAFTEIKTRPNFRMDPLYCHLFIPGARAYGLRDTIPFHVQLNGLPHSIKKFLLRPEHNDVTSEQSHSTKRLSSQYSSYPRPTVRVYLLRQVTIETRGHKTCQNIILAEGKCREVLPAIPSCQSTETVHLDWEGELKCQDDITVGSFVAGNVAVKDSIGLQFEPPNPKNVVAPFFSVYLTVPIKLVTDSYIEVTDYGDHVAVL